MDEFYNDVSGEASSYYFLIETEELESDRGNNSEFVYLHPDYDITLIAGSGGNVSGSGTYVKGNDAILIATPLTTPKRSQSIFMSISVVYNDSSVKGNPSAELFC